MHKLRTNKTVVKYDQKFFFLVIILTILGLIAVADASAPQALNVFNDKFYFFKQQSISAIVGIVVFLIVSRIDYKIWEKLALPMFVGSVGLLLIVLIPGLGTHALGARRWLNLGFTSLQPSELTKLTLAIYLAKVAAKEKGPFAYFIPFVIVVGLIMLQPDLGTTLVTSVMAMSQIFASGLNLLYFVGAMGVGGLGGLILILTSSYRRDRLLTFFQNAQDPLGRDYHVRQILLGLGSGGLFGLGLGQSRQKFLFLPEASTDSIFAILAEEIGFIGSMVLICLFIYFIYRGFMIAKQAPDKFSKVLAIGITSWIGGQMFLNISSMVSLTPLTGIPLPFFSFGGSALVMILTACGILLSISRHSYGKN